VTRNNYGHGHIRYNVDFLTDNLTSLEIDAFPGRYLRICNTTDEKLLSDMARALDMHPRVIRFLGIPIKNKLECGRINYRIYINDKIKGWSEYYPQIG
jgi:hypothetical protein